MKAARVPFEDCLGTSFFFFCVSFADSFTGAVVPGLKLTYGLSFGFPGGGCGSDKLSLGFFSPFTDPLGLLQKALAVLV